MVNGPFHPSGSQQTAARGHGVHFAPSASGISYGETDAVMAWLNANADLLARSGSHYSALNSSPMITHGGLGSDIRLIDKVLTATGQPGTITTTSAMRTFRVMRVKWIALASPYVEPKLEQIFTGPGF